MKVFAMNQCDWWAAETSEEAKAAYLKETGTEAADEPLDPFELDGEAMEHLRFTDEDGTTRSFREQLEKMVAEGQEFPALFATTEY